MIHITGQVCEVTVRDGDSAEQKEILLKNIGEALRFPSYYGQNLDALADCLSDLEWLPIAAVTLVIYKFNRLSSDLQTSLIDVFRDSETSHKPRKLTVVVFD